MRAVVQRVRSAAVWVDGVEVSRIGIGIAVLLGIGRMDDESKAAKLAEKIASLRIFEDDQGKMNLSVLDVGGEALVVSQFTLYADCRRGRRPGFEDAAPPKDADRLYNTFVEEMINIGVPVKTGIFQAKMLFQIENYGPVTIILDSEDLERPRRG